MNPSTGSARFRRRKAEARRMSAERRSVRAQNVRAWRSAAGAAIVLTFVILVIFFLGGARSARPDPGS